MAPPDAQTMIEAMARLARAVAHAELLPRYRHGARARKLDGSFVTDADLAAQRALAAELPRIAAGSVIGEEMTADAQRAAWERGREHGVWIVDPLDGTTNFTQGLPYFAVSIAWWVAGRPRAGVVFNPVLDELFDAVAGGGARLNGVPLACAADAPALADAVAGVEPKYLPRSLAAALAVAPPFYSQRNWGAGALDWCYLAAGRLDVYAHGGQRLWDYAAGALVLAEAGGAFATFDATDFFAGDPWTRAIVAARSATLLAPWRDWLLAARAQRA